MSKNKNNGGNSNGTNSNQSDTAADGTVATATEATTSTRETRNNHPAAKSHPITNDETAQSYADAVREATRNDKPSTMYNASGFVTPSTLDRHSAENRERMAVSIIDSLAGSVEQDGEEGQRARQALLVISSYANSAGARREAARNARILAQADAIRARQATKAH